jgi:parallel beta-helix repeat protein
MTRLWIVMLTTALLVTSCNNWMLNSRVSPFDEKGTPTVNSDKNFYVATDGNDSNPGTLALPWKTIQYAVNKANPGNTIFVRGGTYSESVKITRSGWPSLPITLTRYNGEVVTINGGEDVALYPHGATPKYWIIDGLRLLSTNTFTVQFDSWSCNGICNGIDHWTFKNNYISGAMYIYGAYNLIDGNEVDGTVNNGNGGNGIQDLYDVSHHNIFRNNNIHNFSQRGIWSMHRTHDNQFVGNTIHDIGVMCIDTDGYGTVEWRHTIRGNTIYNCKRGIEMENTFASVVENNIIHDTKSNGIDVINYGATISADGTDKCQVGGESNQYGDTDGNNDCEGNITNNIIRQNLFYNTGSAAAIISYHAGGIKILGNTIVGKNGSKWGLWLDSSYCPQIELQSNIFLGHSESEILLNDYDLLTVDNNNLFFNSNSNNIYQKSDGQTYWQYQSLSQYQLTTGKGKGSLFGDPLFLNDLDTDFHLGPNSPAINHGVSIGVTTDLDGNIRPHGAGFDIGAYETH